MMSNVVRSLQIHVLVIADPIWNQFGSHIAVDLYLSRSMFGSHICTQLQLL
jgi:hypothetical protein